MSHGRVIGRLLRRRVSHGSRLNRLSRTWCRSLRLYSSISAGDLQFGQPLYETHPHLLQPGELTPGISAQEYADRRTRLAQQLPHGAVAIVAAADVVQRSGSCFYQFFQDPDFLYLTGFNEPEALAIVGKDDSGQDHTFHLYVREKDAKAETWDGARSGTQAAVDVFNADETGDIASVKTLLPRVLSTAEHVYTDVTQPDNSVSGLWRFLYGSTRRRTDFADVIDTRKIKQLRPVMNSLRAIKSQSEMGQMHQAAHASGISHNNAITQHFTREKNLDAFLRYQFMVNGCDQIAYEPVVAGGRNGLGIHYVRNDDVLHNEEMVLVDAAGKRGGYISDITRTWPIAGRFSPAQRDLYQAVLNVQCTLVNMCCSKTNVTLDRLHSLAESLLEQQLRDIGFDMSGKAIETLFPHHISHYIGMDVHDTVGYSRKTVLREGHCITIEPGVYVPDDERWPKHFRNMAVRIEDSVAIGEDAPLVLTATAVKEIADIEALRV